MDDGSIEASMKLPRRQFLHLATARRDPSLIEVASAQSYPLRTVRVIVGFAAGGVVDVFARLTAQRLSERLGQQFVVQNRTGAAGNFAPTR